jgi:hypothetical protein
MWIQVLLAGILPAQAASFDAPNLGYELELHRQYMRSQGQVADGPMAKDAYVENYDIQRGETLWSLSKILYGDGAYWPRVWAQNNGITNPHLIRPGHQLQFLMGSEDDTPAFRFTESGEETGVERTAATSNAANIEIPPPEITPRPVINVPPSFPEWQSIYREAPKVQIDDRALSRKRDEIADRVYLRAWVEEKDIDPIGNFMENDTESGLPVVDQYVFVKIKKGQGQVGQKLLIAHSAGKLRRTQDEYDNRITAYLIQVAGELQITESMPSDFLRSRDRDEYDAFRALMTKTTGLSLKGNALIAGEIQYANLSAEGPHGTTQAEVIGSERNISSLLFGQGDIVFLDKGSSNGVAVGQIMDVYGNRKSRYPGTPVKYSPAPSGRLKIVRVTNGLATALVLNAHDSIVQGDLVKEIVARPPEVEKLPQRDITPISGGVIQRMDPSSGGSQ